MSYNTCAYCKDFREGGSKGNFIRYSTRRVAHPQCWLDRGRTLAELPWHQIEHFPFRLLKERGLLDEARNLIEAKNMPRSARQKRLDKLFASSAHSCL